MRNASVMKTQRSRARWRTSISSSQSGYEREHDELCESGAAAAVQDPRFVADRGVFEQPEFVPIARHVVHRGDAKRGESRHSEP